MATRAAADPRQSRGYRNKNPGNIDWNPANKWQGQIGIEPAPGGGGRPRFAVFADHVWGIRALAALLIAYQDKHGLRTISQIINRWAPPADNNNVSAYVRHVCELTGRGSGDMLDLHAYGDLRPLVEAIITHELGGQPYDAATLDEGLRRAGVVRPVETLREAAATGSGQGAVTVAGAVGTAVAAAPLITAMGSLPQWTGVALIGAVAVLALAWVLTQRKARG